MAEKIKESILSEILSNYPEVVQRGVVLGLSGGVDSIVLLHLLIKCGIPVFAVHCNYFLRGEDSIRDASFCSEICEKLEVPIVIYDCSLKHLAHEKGNIQEHARVLRYQAFKEVMSSSNARFICTAHHADDQSETIIYKFFKGGRISSLSGMSRVDSEYCRPLLPFRKAEIKEFAQQNRLQWREDSSNEKTEYERNYIRKEIAPKIERLNPNFVTTLGKSALYFQSLNSFIQNVKIEEKVLKPTFFPRGKLLTFESFNPRSPEALFILEQLLGFYQITLSQLIEFLRQETVGATIDSSSVKVLWDVDGIFIFEPKETPIIKNCEYIENEEDLCRHLNEWIEIFEKNTLTITMKQLQVPAQAFPLVLRVWEAGDAISINNGRKKVKKILQEARIPHRLRQYIPVLTSKKEVLAVLPLRKHPEY